MDDAPGWSVLGEAEFSGVAAIASWPIDAVRGLLHSDVALQTPDGWDARRHPVAVVYGMHAGGATRLAGVRIPLGRSYREFGVMVPGVTTAGNGAAATAVISMYADYFPAVWNGRNRYGFAKQEVAVHWSGPSYVVTNPDGRLVCTARIDSNGDWQRGIVPLGLDQIASGFCGTLLGWSPAGRRMHTPSAWVLTDAAFRPVWASAIMDVPLVGTSVAGELLRPLVAAFEVRAVGWQLGWPEPEAERIS